VRKKGFTLVELLVVVAVIALLIAVLVPALSSARKSARAVVCQVALRTIGQGFVLYNGDNQDLVVPSYNMTGTAGGASVPLDGWGPILDRDGYMESYQGTQDNPFYCPDTVDVAGVATGQTGDNPDNPKGWLDWPFARTGTANIPQTIPSRGFNKIIRVAYWINADNPIGTATTVTPDVFYTASVGYGPGTNGLSIRQSRTSVFKRPSMLVTVADGLYAGRQRDNQIGTTNCRIGYRHPGRNSSANVAFADGHVGALGGKEFPRALGGTNVVSEVRAENLTSGATVYANPEKSLGP